MFNRAEGANRFGLICRPDSAAAVRLTMENERLREENAQLRELLGIAGPVGPPAEGPARAVQNLRTAASSLPDAATAPPPGRVGTVSSMQRPIRAAGCPPGCPPGALRHDSLMRCRIAQLERQVRRAEAELQARPGCPCFRATSILTCSFAPSTSASKGTALMKTDVTTLLSAADAPDAHANQKECKRKHQQSMLVYLRVEP